LGLRQAGKAKPSFPPLEEEMKYFARSWAVSFGLALRPCVCRLAGREARLKTWKPTIPDFRRQASVNHTIEQMFRQRIYTIGCGEEDLNDHDELRHDIALQTAGDGRSLPKSSKIKLNLLKRSHFISFFSFIAPLQESISYSCNIRVSVLFASFRGQKICEICSQE